MKVYLDTSVILRKLLEASGALIYSEKRKEPLVMLTHDRQLATAARAAGLKTAGAEE